MSKKSKLAKCFPVVDGRYPDNKLALEGEQTVPFACAWVKRTPRAASRFMFGVYACGCPSKPSTYVLRSSVTMSKMFGLAAEVGVGLGVGLPTPTGGPPGAVEESDPPQPVMTASSGSASNLKFTSVSEI